MSRTLTCIELVEGCPDCETEQRHHDSIDHLCGELCKIGGEARRNDETYHRLSHRTERCQRCRKPISDRLGLNNLCGNTCPSACCVVLCCKFCGNTYASFGPVDCPTYGSLGRRPAVRRMRYLYRVKRKHW